MLFKVQSTETPLGAVGTSGDPGAKGGRNPCALGIWVDVD